LAIEWPFPAGERPIVSDKDAQGVSITTAEFFS